MKTFRLRKSFLFAALLPAFVGALIWQASAQSQDKAKTQKPQEADTLRIDTELVQIDVVVTDKQGKLVSDLKREDFQLLEDGKPQQISHFSVGTAGRQAAWLRKEPKPAAGKNDAPTPAAPVFTAGRYLVLAVDDLHLTPGNLMFAKQSLNKFLDQQAGANDQLAMITTSGGLGLYQQFTPDREAVKRAVNRLSPRDRKVTSDSDVPRITPYQAELIDMNDPDALELAVQELIRQQQMQRPMAVSMAQARARQIVAENTSVTVNTLSTLENVIRGLRDLPGRKVIVLLSDGFLLGGFSNGRHFDVRRITDAATRAGVVIYSLDTRGLIAMPASMDASQRGFPETGALAGARMRIENSSIEAERDGMFALAKDTGGDAIFNNNDINAGLQKVLNDTETYYLLAFEPLVSYRDGRYRKLDIRIPSRPELKVRTRKGYFAPDDKAAEKEARAVAKAEEKDKQKTPEKLAKDQQSAAAAQVREGLSALYPLRGIPVEIATHFINTAKDGVSLDVIAHIDAAAVRFNQVNDRHQATVELVGVVFDESGKSVETFGDKLVMNLKPASLEQTIKNGIIYGKQLKMKPGFYQVRFVAREDGVRQIGSASSWIEIPNLEKKQLALSSIFFPAAGEASPSGATTQTINEKVTDDSVARHPATVYRRFKRKGNFDFMIFAYNAKLNEKGAADLALQTQIYSGNKLVLATPLKNFQQSEQSGSSQGIPASEGFPYLARLSLGDFEPGNYELRLVVIDRNAKASAKRSVSFTVE
ncbi:MAG TPA: VWA domain-containing protein [Blastocatellia bacterium]|nr:VWA domain-containing protein [Blastocatellia bacterium]HMX26583.1 VWA domain-containing protein [Blastocatellia bacterium]HMY74130.1 VWA domain-containing protein [Blastocatellia bacterium]HMZ16620.1 VWA domain-containing protein [Blastocatellia bacterium]HNG28187.1 VWA domain-containing protein [Blastocatellia bacterium]